MPKITSDKLNERQNAILAFVEANESVSIGQIFEHIQKDFEKITRITVSRDLEKLLKLNLIDKQGESKRTVVYRISSQYSIMKNIYVEKYQ